MSNPMELNHGTRDYAGTKESNGLANPKDYHEARMANGDPRTVDWTEEGLVVTRLRLLTDHGFPMYDVSYCHGMIGDEHVDVMLPFHQLLKAKWKSQIIAYAKKDGVFAKGLGILDNSSTLV